MELNSTNSRQLGVGRSTDTVTTHSQLLHTTVFWSFLEGKDYADTNHKHIGEFSLALQTQVFFQLALLIIAVFLLHVKLEILMWAWSGGLQNIAPSLTEACHIRQ